MIGSGAGTVPEVEHPEWAGGKTYNALQKVIVKGAQGAFTDFVAGTKDWQGMTAAPNSDVYACVWGGSIWKQTGGVGLFVDLVAGNKNWSSMASAPNSDVYACVWGGSIWKQTGGTGAFADLATGSKNWAGMTAAPNGDIYACVSTGDIWISTDAGVSFSAIADTDRDWYGMAAAPNGDIYACVNAGSIWKRTGGAGAFADLVAGNKDWQGMASAPNGDVYACVNAGSIWKQTGGTGAFVDLVTGSKAWSDLTVSSNGDAFGVYACVYGGSIWVTNLEVVHKIYESLVGSNIGYYPPIDVKQTTPKWLEVSSTNKWKVFDQKTSSQMEAATGLVYTITPGVVHDSIALLNLVATSIRVVGTSAAYDTTVSTGAKDIVLTNLGGLAANVLTITINNTAGLAKCGEIVIGTSSTLGTMKPHPVVSMQNYSTKTQDVFGDWTIVARASSEKLNCQINVAYGSIDTVINLIETYKTTPVVWIGNSSYSCLIVYGFTKDYSAPVATIGKTILSLEIEGIT